MKIMRSLLIIGVSAVALLFSVERSSFAQPHYNTAGGVVTERLERLTSELTSSGQTNALAQVNGLVTAIEVLEQTKEATTTHAILRMLRSGNTNAAIGVLESELDSSLIYLGSVPKDEIREAQLQTLDIIKKYRSKYPEPKGDPAVDAAVARAFDLLDKK